MTKRVNPPLLDQKAIKPLGNASNGHSACFHRAVASHRWQGLPNSVGQRILVLHGVGKSRDGVKRENEIGSGEYGGRDGWSANRNANIVGLSHHICPGWTEGGQGDGVSARVGIKVGGICIGSKIAIAKSPTVIGSA